VMPKHVSVLALVVGALFVAGCSGSGPKITGTVTFNGAPVEGATVTFYGESSDPQQPGEMFSAKTDASGRFRLAVPAGTRIKSGSYKVTVVKVTPKPGAKVAEGTDPTTLITTGLGVYALPPIYANLTSTPLKADVKSGDTDVPLTLESGKPPGTP
jgi:hypothetical protein